MLFVLSYEFEECRVKYRGEWKSRKCPSKKFPNHKFNHVHEKICWQYLLKTITSPSGAKLLYPFKSYCYQPIENSLQTLISREGFEEQCEKWRKKETSEAVLTDVYDGRVWKSFKRKGEHFFAKERNYGLFLNVDWFQPFKHVASFSIGAIYLVIMNLLRTERFQRNNVILVGIIPNLVKEPSTNTFLKPLVIELKKAWTTGFKLTSPITNKVHRYHLALLCVGCDIPACRKLCGFLGNSFILVH